MGDIVVHRGDQNINLFSLLPFRTITKAEHVQELLSLDRLNINIESSNPIEFFIGDYIYHENRKFTLNLNPRLQKNSESQFIYDLQFEGVQYDLLRKKYFNYDAEGNYTTGDFPLTGEIDVFLTCLRNNANRDESEYTWLIGVYPSDTEAKTITFDNNNCLQALQAICSKDNFDVEFEIIQDVVAKTNTLNIKKIGSILSYSFEYGKGNGLYSLIRENVSEGQIITRLFPFGSTENIPTNYRNFSPRLKLPSSYGSDYIEDAEKIQIFGLVEEIVNYDDIKPTFKGIVSSSTVVNNGIFSLVVNNMDFDLNEKKEDGSTKYLIAGTPAKIHVNKGNLAGYEFDIHKYTHTTKTFEIKQFADERGQKFPDDSTVFKFSVGDEFTLIDIIMPDVRIAEAEEKLKAKALEEFEKLSQNNVQYNLDIDPEYFKLFGNEETKFLSVGDYVNIVDSQIGIDKTSRITTLKRDLLNVFKYEMSIADTYEISIAQQVLQDINIIKTEIKTNSQNNILAMLNGYRRMLELQGMVFDTDGYFDPTNIKPNSIETNMLSIGARSQQLTLNDVVFTPNKNGNINAIQISSGNLIHFSIDNTGIREWSLLEVNKNDLLENQSYYIYARVLRTGNTGSYLITTEQIKFDSEENYYNFLLAALFKPIDDVRLIQLLYGSTFINGRTVTTGRISSVDGLTWFDLDTGQIRGKIEFSDDSPAYDQLASGGENLIYLENDTYNFIEKTERYFGKNLSYVFSVDVDNSYSSTSGIIYLIGKKDGLYSVIGQKEIEFKSNGINRISISIEFKINDYQRIFCKVYDSGEHDLTISNLKLETGSRASDYSEAQYLINKRISEIESRANWYTTTISGNIITTGTVLLGNYETGANGGITGTGGIDDVFLWGGSNYAGRNTAPIRILRNGKFYANDAYMSGEIVATKGWFGTGDNGFRIYEQGIKSDKGWIFLGKANSGNDIKFIQLAGDSIGTQATIEDRTITADNKVGLFLNVSGSTGLNYALQIAGGDVVVQGKKGFTGTRQVEEWQFEITNGIITNLTHTG